MSKEQLITSSHCLLLKPRGSDNAVSKFMHLRDVSPLRDSAKVHFLINMAQYCDNGPKLTEEAVEDNTHDDMWREDPNQMNNHFRTILQSVEKIWIILGWYFMTMTGFSGIRNQINSPARERLLPPYLMSYLSFSWMLSTQWTNAGCVFLQIRDMLNVSLCYNLQCCALVWFKDGNHLVNVR